VKAEAGDMYAQAKLGLYYELGKGRAKDDAKALHWLRKSAEQGNVVAQAKLGSWYQRGNIVEKDVQEAFKWTKMSADNGFMVAQVTLGNCYRNGEGVEKDNVRALMWFYIAAECGDFTGTSERNIEDISKDMLEAEIDEAQRLSGAWLKENANKAEMATPGKPSD
jgi:TPR repeat protein